MQNKYVLMACLVGVVIVVGLGWKVLSSSRVNTSAGNTTVSLFTDPNPLRMGSATFTIEVKDETGKLVNNATVSFDLNMTAMNMGTQQGNATSQGNGRYAASGRMSMRGSWRMTTKVTMPDGNVINKDFTVNVP